MFKFIHTCLKWFKLLQTGSNYQNLFKLVQTIQTCPKWFKSVQIGSNLSEMLQTYLKNYNELCTIALMPYLAIHLDGL